MLNSLSVKNYRNLKDLKIKSLDRVNLITGKNNTGKSSVLEAVAIYATKGDLNFIFQLLEERKEYFRAYDTERDAYDYTTKALSNLFSNRKIGFDDTSAILIGQSGGKSHGDESILSIQFVKYIDEIQKDTQGGSVIRKRIILHDEENLDFEDAKIGIEIKVENNSFLFRIGSRRMSYNLDANKKIQFIRTRNIDKEINGKLFDQIALTEKEQFVIEALKIIEPLTERIAFIEESNRERFAVIKLSSSQTVLPLGSMGDGINRILTIILALVNSDNGYLLIDEFENGLHYTVQEKLWEIIFTLSQKLNVQVFVTTHSEDCIFGFESVLSIPENLDAGKLIRLDNVKGSIRQVEFNANELKIANDQHIEIR